MPLRLLSTLCVLVLALGLAACGGNGGDSNEDQIRDLVETFYGNEEGVCDVVTTNLLEDQFESKEDCEEAAAEAEPEEGYEIEDISVEGDEGEVDVRVDDQSGTLVVKQEDGEWKVDGIKQREQGGEMPTTPDETPTTPDE